MKVRIIKRLLGSLASSEMLTDSSRQASCVGPRNLKLLKLDIIRWIFEYLRIPTSVASVITACVINIPRIDDCLNAQTCALKRKSSKIYGFANYFSSNYYGSLYFAILQ